MFFYVNFTLYCMNIFMLLTFFYMFIVLSTFTTISYIPIEKRVPQNAQKAPPQSFVPAVGLLMRNYCFFLLTSMAASPTADTTNRAIQMPEASPVAGTLSSSCAEAAAVLAAAPAVLPLSLLPLLSLP